MTVFDFVKTRFGSDSAEYLRNIRTGGDNNKKGCEYEIFYAVSKICDIAANEVNLSDFIISDQQDAFVDDICVQQISTKVKTNYQAKNSSGAAADWNDDIKNRFDLQRQIDMEFHKCNDSLQILLVSCPNKKAANGNKIPSNMRNFCFSEYFPYYKSIATLVLSYPMLRLNLEKLCNSNEVSVLDEAYRLVLSSYMGNPTQVRIDSIMASARALAKPDIFVDFSKADSVVPEWLIDKCSEFEGINIKTESSRIIVCYNGFELTLSAYLDEPESSVINALNEPSKFLAFLMSKTQAEL
jgi:hypothetical protein